MSAEIEIGVARPGDGPGITRVQHDGWRAYINSELGITLELIDARFADVDERNRKKEEQIRVIGRVIHEKPTFPNGIDLPETLMIRTFE